MSGGPSPSRRIAIVIRCGPHEPDAENQALEYRKYFHESEDYYSSMRCANGLQTVSASEALKKLASGRSSSGVIWAARRAQHVS
eukprot:6184641-Pleurochrysis_carterae.AAC.1